MLESFGYGLYTSVAYTRVFMVLNGGFLFCKKKLLKAKKEEIDNATVYAALSSAKA